MLNPFILVPGVIVTGMILITLLRNEYIIRRKYKDGNIKKPFTHPPDKH